MSQRRKFSYLDIGEIAQSLRSHVKLRNIISFGYLNYAEIWCSLPIFQQNSWKMRRHIPYFFFTIMGEVARSKWLICSQLFLWLPRIEGSHLMKGLSIWLRIKLIDLTTSDMYWYVNTCRSRCLHQSKLFAVDWTVSNLSWTPPNVQIEYRLLDEFLHKVVQRQHTISSSFPKYMYVPHQQDSYGPDITKNQHSKIDFIFTTTRKVHHRKIENVHLKKHSWFIRTPGQTKSRILRCEISIGFRWYIIAGYYDTSVEKYRFCTTGNLDKPWTPVDPQNL